jgi:hypothetical protein
LCKITFSSCNALCKNYIDFVKRCLFLPKKLNVFEAQRSEIGHRKTALAAKAVNFFEILLFPVA